MYANLKLQLWKTGIRQNRLAQLLGLDESVLSRIVNGYREASPTLRLDIAHVLGCEESWLFESAPQSTNSLDSKAASPPQSLAKGESD
jgi:transcriptional regulator with XRE-family HTH domain